VTFSLALGLRLLNLPFAAIPVADELYHWKRIEFSAQHFPQVLELDRDRGLRGAFCPWPPLYDLSAGLVARIFGMGAVRFIPPVAGAIAVAVASMWTFALFGSLAGWTAGIALACSPFVVTQSWIGAIDHHFLEWILVFFVARSADRSPRSAAIAMTAAVFVQTALIIACGLLFVILWMRDERRWALAFVAVAAAVSLYRLTRAPGYPDTAWFLGWPHVLLLIAAATALLVRPRLLGLACGIAIALLAPVGQGLHFFGGDRWLQSIVEFQPLWRSSTPDLISQLAGLGAGAVLAWRQLRGRASARPIALCAISFLLLTIINRRFWSISIPLLAIAGAIDAASFARRNLRFAAAAAVALVPVIQLAAWMRHPNRPIERYQMAWVEAANFLRTQPKGRVLAPWSMGHTFDVIGKQPVVIDGFGTMPDERAFWDAVDALEHQEKLGEYCAANGVRYVVDYADRPKPEGLVTIYRSDPSFMRAALRIWRVPSWSAAARRRRRRRQQAAAHQATRFPEAGR
jgi:hypothetical protein